MKVIRNERADNKIELAVTVPAKTANEVLERAIYNLAAQNNIDLLDHNDLPAAVFDTVGEAQYKAYTETYAADFLAPFAISEERLEIVMMPYTEAKTPLVQDKEFSFSIVATPKPYFELSSYDPVSITMPKITFEDFEVDEQLADMAQNYGVKVIDDSWIKENITDIGDLQSLRTLLKEEGLKLKQTQTEDMKAMLATDELTERFIGQIPDDLFKYTSDDMKRSFEEQLRQQGMTKEEYFSTQGGNEQQLTMNMMMETREVLTQSLSLDSMALHNGLTVTESDIDATFEAMAPGHGAEAKQQFENSGHMYLIREAALRRKTTQWLVDTANITYAA